MKDNGYNWNQGGTYKPIWGLKPFTAADIPKVFIVECGVKIICGFTPPNIRECLRLNPNFLQ